jgi:hypothetical protein
MLGAAMLRRQVEESMCLYRREGVTPEVAIRNSARRQQ